jgi:hypothetical protein
MRKKGRTGRRRRTGLKRKTKLLDNQVLLPSDRTTIHVALLPKFLSEEG